MPPIIIEKKRKFIDKNYLSISESQIDYLNLENSARNKEREMFSRSKCRHCGGSQPTEKLFKQQKKEKWLKEITIQPTQR